MTPLIWILLFVLLFCIPFIRFCIRVFLLKWKITGFCQKKGYEICWHRDPFPSALFPQEGYDFFVKTPQRSYEVKLLSARHRLREYCFINESQISVNRKISFNLIARGRGLKGMGILNSVDFGLSSKMIPIDLQTEARSGAEKILLFYPIAKDVTWIAHGGGKKYLGNGDLFFKDFRMLSRSAFLEELSSPGKYLRKVNPWEKY